MAGEAKFERALCEHAKLHRWWTKKIVAPDRNGDPDRLFLRRGRWVMIELKDEGEEPTELQHRRIADIRAHGGEAYWCDNMRDACAILKIPVPASW